MGDLADLFPGFSSHHIPTPNGHVFARAGGKGEPLILAHGYPQTHAMWHKIAPELAKRFHVIAFDLRGYGWSSVVRGSEAGSDYSKRAMGEDLLAIAEEFGFATFRLVGHDRGARVAYRFALDHPGRVEKLALLDIIPTSVAWERIEAGATSYPHWPFLAGPAPQPEQEIAKDPIAWQDSCLAKWSGTGDLSAFDRRALHHYHAFFNEPSRIHATCEDYRAGATLDVAHDRVSLAAGEMIHCPVLALWGDKGLPGKGSSPLDAWRALAPDVTGEAIPAGHFVAEENPEATLRALKAFLA
jgi:haloacetate dehalogenase